MIDNVVCTNKFKKAVKKLIAKNKIYGKELLDTIEHLRTNNFTTNNDLRRHKLKGNLAGFYDIHFSPSNDDLVLIYSYRNDGTLFILEIQNVTNHRRLKSEVPTKNYVNYDEKEIFSDIVNESYKNISQNRLFNLYLELKDKCDSLESTEYEDGYYDAMTDMIKTFDLQKFFS